jgi:hypothetical protein
MMSLAATPAGAVGGWTVVATPNPSTEANYLSAATAIAPNDVWAVGTAYQSSGSAGTLTEHWDGSAWKAVRSPNPHPGYNELFAVDAISAGDVWAVGYTLGIQYVDEKTLIEHWNGARWSAVPSPNLGSNANILNGVSAVAADDIWAVGRGNSTSTQRGRPIVQHWDGTTWALVPSPSTGGGFAELTAVVALSSDDVWAVGYRGSRTLIEHWNGSVWRLVPGPLLPSSFLLGLTAVGHDDVWAGGSSAGASLIEHWNGTAWTRVPSPNGSKANTEIRALAPFGADDIWAVGDTGNDLQTSFRTVTEHWDGTRWNLVSSPNPSKEYDFLTGVTGMPGGDIWAVGQDEDTLAIRRQDA